jgi:hypothetical protein
MPPLIAAKVGWISLSRLHQNYPNNQVDLLGDIHPTCMGNHKGLPLHCPLNGIDSEHLREKKVCDGANIGA